MTISPDSQPAIALVDDDMYSARLMSRVLVAQGAPVVTVFDDPEAALETLAAQAESDGETLVVVDLKDSSSATAAFVARLRKAAPHLPVVAMCTWLDREARNTLLQAGAAAVFERHADLVKYRTEAASIVSFLTRRDRADRFGT